MKLKDFHIKVVCLTPEEFEALPEDQQNRIMELERKLKQYDSMLKTLVVKYTSKLPAHKTLDDILYTYEEENN